MGPGIKDGGGGKGGRGALVRKESSLSWPTSDLLQTFHVPEAHRSEKAKKAKQRETEEGQGDKIRWQGFLLRDKQTQTVSPLLGMILGKVSMQTRRTHLQICLLSSGDELKP